MITMKTMVALWGILFVALCSAHTEVQPSCYDHAISYNFYDVLAQATCAAKYTGTKRIWALRRICPSATKTCNEICSINSMTCFQAMHVYKNPPVLAENCNSQPDQGVPGLSILMYNNGCGISQSNCGPNYCCCSGAVDVLVTK